MHLLLGYGDKITLYHVIMLYVIYIQNEKEHRKTYSAYITLKTMANGSHCRFDYDNNIKYTHRMRIG